MQAVYCSLLRANEGKSSGTARASGLQVHFQFTAFLKLSLRVMVLDIHS